MDWARNVCWRLDGRCSSLLTYRLQSCSWLHNNGTSERQQQQQSGRIQRDVKGLSPTPYSLYNWTQSMQLGVPSSNTSGVRFANLYYVNALFHLWQNHDFDEKNNIFQQCALASLVVSRLLAIGAYGYFLKSRFATDQQQQRLGYSRRCYHAETGVGNVLLWSRLVHSGACWCQPLVFGWPVIVIGPLPAVCLPQNCRNILSYCS